MARVAEDVRLFPRSDHRVPPQNLEAEESVLGSMMLSSEAIADVVEILEPDDFYRSANAKIYASLRGLYARGEPVDLITAVAALDREGTLDDVGGRLYLRDLTDQVPTPASAGHYALIVSRAALRRRLISAAAEIMESAYVSSDDAEAVADAAEQRVYDVARREDAEEIAMLRELVDQAMLDLETIQNRESAYTGLPTGFRDLDDLTSGLQPGNLIVIAARPGVGKSSLAMNMARNVAVDEHPVAVFSLEMSRYEIGMRLLCAEARVPWDRIRSKRVGPQDWSNVVHAAEVLHDAPLLIVDAGNVNIVDIRAKARRMRTSRKGLSLIIVDYMQLMTSPNARRPDNRQQEVAEISRSLKLLAKELHIPVVALSQLNRNPETRADKRPQLSDLRECVPAETLVCLADGRRVPIGDLVGQEPDVLAMAPGGRLIEARSDRVWPVGVRPIVEVALASGRSIRCTAEHRLFGASGWVRVKDIGVGDRLALAHRLPEPARCVRWPDDRVARLGRFVGDGKRVPSDAFRLPTDQIAVLLRQLWATGGCIHAGLPGSAEGNRVSFSTGSRAHAEDVAALLLRFAVVARIRQVTAAGRRARWHVEVAGPIDQRRFLRLVATFGPQAEDARTLADALDGAAERARTVPPRRTSGSGTRLAPTPTRALVAERAASDDADRWATEASNDLYWDRVLAARSVGREEVFDITVPGPVSWVAGAGGVISHNSGAIEQDSDVVMFIHRDDADPEKKREAELIIAKHRNGPTGSVRLNFEPALTQFRNAARGDVP